MTVHLLEQAALVLAITLFVALFAREERRNLFRIAIVYVFAILCQLLSAFAAAHEYPDSSRILFFFALLLRGIAYINLGATVVFSLLLRLARLEPPRILRDLAIAFSYIGLMLLMFAQYKVDVTGIVATSAVITAVVGFSLQDVLQNVMGGIALQIDHSIAVGDWVKFGDVSGMVREISWRRVSIESRNGDLFVVPNSLFVKNQVMIQGRRWSGPRQERRWVYFEVDYRFSPTTIVDAVADALTREPIEGVAADPPAHAIVIEFKDGVARYAARYWLTNLAADDLTDSRVRVRVYFALKRIHVPMSMSSSAVYLHRGDRDEPFLVEPKQADRLKVLRGVPIFASLTEEESGTLAGRMIYSPFVAGEAIIVQGHAVHHLYILTAGRVEVRLSVEGAPPTRVATLEAPNFFGEGGMLTGEPRRATIIALTDAECWRVDKEAFQGILRARPEIAQNVSEVLAQRNVGLAAVKEGLSDEARRAAVSSEHQSVLARIEKFFGL